MATGTDVIANAMLTDRLFKRRHAIGAQATYAQKLIDWIGMQAGEEFTTRVSPEILIGAGDIHAPRCDQGNEHVLIDGNFGFAAVVLVEVFAEPMWKRVVDSLHRFAKRSARERGSSAARFI